MEDIATLVKNRRRELGLSQESLAAAAGTSQGTIDKIENGRSQQSRFLPAVFKVLDLSLDLLVESKDSADIPAISVTPQKPIPRHMLVGDADLPIYTSVRAGNYADSVLVSPEAIDYVMRPEPLAKARNGYGLYVMGDSMEPAYRQGDLALIHPNLPPKPGDEVVVCSVDENGEYYALLKQLVRATADKWVLRQYNPGPGEEKEFSLNRKEWPVCQLVVGNYRRR